MKLAATTRFKGSAVPDVPGLEPSKYHGALLAIAVHQTAVAAPMTSIESTTADAMTFSSFSTLALRRRARHATTAATTQENKLPATNAAQARTTTL